MATYIFDLGGVIIPDPIETAASKIEGVTKEQSIWVRTMTTTYKPTWNLADCGKMSGIDCIEGLKKQLPAPYTGMTVQQIINKAVELACADCHQYLFDYARNAREKGHQVGIFSNQIDVLAERLSEALDLEHRFDAVVFSCFVGCKKNDPAIYAHIADLLGGNEQEYHYFDDRPKNFPPAQARGWQIHYVVDHPIPLPPDSTM